MVAPCRTRALYTAAERYPGTRPRCQWRPSRTSCSGCRRSPKRIPRRRLGGGRRHARRCGICKRAPGREIDNGHAAAYARSSSHMNRADEFNTQRPLLFSIAYRMLGSRPDAEDAVQETFLRWQKADEEEVQSPRSYLATVITRL